MIIEAVRIVRSWLEDDQYGVNAMIATLTPNVGDLDVPEVKEILDEVTHQQVMLGEPPTRSPAIYIMLDEPVQMEAIAPTGNSQKITDLPIAIRYLRAKIDQDKARLATLYTLRAIVKSLVRLDKNVNQSSRSLNNIYLERMINLSVLDPRETVGDCQVMGAVLVTYQAFENDP
jgi:hypothetical protein